MKNWLYKISAFLIAATLLVFSAQAATVTPVVEDFKGSGVGTATAAASGVKISGDWGSKVEYAQPVKVDGFSITLGGFNMDGNFGSLCFILSPEKGGVNHGATGNGFMIKIWNYGSTYMDAADTSISGWNDLPVAKGGTLKDAWLSAIIPDTSMTIDFALSADGSKYIVTNSLNPTNANFTVDAAVLNKAMNANGEAYLTFYAWNNTTVSNSMVVERISGVSGTASSSNAATTTTTTKSVTTTTTKKDTVSTTTTVSDPTDTTTTAADIDTTTTTVADTTTTTNGAVTTTTTVDGGIDTDVPPADNNGWILPVVIVAVLMIAFCGVGIFIVIKRKNAQS